MCLQRNQDKANKTITFSLSDSLDNMHNHTIHYVKKVYCRNYYVTGMQTFSGQFLSS